MFVSLVDAYNFISLLSMEKYIYLDDQRTPIDKKRSIARNYDEFIAEVLKTNWSDKLIISFDHDLEESHYTPEEYWNDYEASKKYQEAQNHTRTWYDCAKRLVDNGHVPYKFFVHSANPVWADNILWLLNNWLDHLYSQERIEKRQWSKKIEPFESEEK